MINFNKKLTIRKVLMQNDINLSKRTMHIFMNNLMYGNIKKQIYLTKKHKMQRVEILQEWLKNRFDFNHVVMKDQKIFRLDGPNNWFS